MLRLIDTGRRATLRHVTRVGLLGIAVVFFLPGATGVIEREFRCEEAATHLADCCEGFDPHDMNCAFVSSCGEAEPDPVLRTEEAVCIRELSCDELVAARVCERVLERQAEMDAFFAGDDGAAGGSLEQDGIVIGDGTVCP
jgi:hypothetical protein